MIREHRVPKLEGGVLTTNDLPMINNYHEVLISHKVFILQHEDAYEDYLLYSLIS